MAVGHTQFVIIMLLLAYIVMSGAMGETSATARAALIAHTLDQLMSGSARYELALRLALTTFAFLACSIAASAEEKGVAGAEPATMIEVEQPVAIAAAVAMGGEPIKPEQHAAIEEQERRTLEALHRLGDGGSPGKPEQHAAVKEQERRAHEALDGLDGSAKRRHRWDDAPPETGPSMLPGGGYEISSDKIPFGNALEPNRLSFATLVATHVLLPGGETPISLVAIATAVAATHVLHPEGEMPASLVAVAAAVATGGEPVEPEQHADDDELEQCALGEFNRLDGNAYATAAEPSGRADELLQGPTNEPDQRAHGDPDGLDGNNYATAA